MKKILLIAALFISSLSYAQSHTFYKNSRGIYTEAQVDSMIAVMQARLNDNGMGQLTAMKEITGETRSGDTLFYSFKTKGVNLELQKKNEAKRNSIIGKPLPAFAFTDINGKKLSSSDFKGKPMVLNLWFTTCPPCIAEMPDLNKVKKENPDVVFVAMTYEDKEKVTSFLSKTTFDFQHVADVREYVEKLEFGYPTTLFIDKNGIVQDITSGAGLKGLDMSVFNQSFKKIKM